MLYFLLISLSLQLTLKEQTQQFCQGIDQIELQSQLSSSNSNVRPLTKKIFENQGSFSSDDYSRLDEYTVPWLLMAIISFFIYLTIFSLCCFDQKCPPFQLCKRDYKYNQYTRLEILIPSIIAVVLNAIIFITSIVGLASVDLKSGFLYSRCQLISQFNVFLEGNQEFAGLRALSQDLELSVNQYNYFQDQLTSTFASRKSLSLTSQYQEILSINDNSQRGLSSSTLPIMIISNGQNLGAAGESYLSSKYIFDYILAYKNDSNYGFINTQYKSLDQTKYQLSLYSQPDRIISYYSNLLSIISALESAQNPLKNKNFAQNLDAGRLSTQSLIEAVTMSGQQIYDALSNVDNTFIQLQDYYTALLIIVLIISVFASFSIFLVLFKKQYYMRSIVHLSWNIYNIMCILTFVAVIFFHPVTVIFEDSCDYFTSYLNDVTFFQNSELISDTQTKQLFYTCLYGNGNFYPQTNLYANINQIATFMNQINNYQNQQNTIESSRLTYLSQISQNYQELQKIYDSTIVDLEPNNPFYQTINSFNQQKSNVGCVELAFTVCSDGTSPTTISSPSPTLCWHPSYFLVKSGSCVQQENDFKILKQHFQAQGQAWAASQQREYQIKEKNSQLDYGFQTYQTEINSFIQDQNKILTAFNQMSYQMNCKTIKTILENAKNGICRHVTYNTYQGLIIVLIINFCLFFGSILNSTSGLRFYREYRYGEYGSTKVYSMKHSSDSNNLAEVKAD